MYAILLVSIIGLAVVIERFWFYEVVDKPGTTGAQIG